MFSFIVLKKKYQSCVTIIQHIKGLIQKAPGASWQQVLILTKPLQPQRNLNNHTIICHTTSIMVKRKRRKRAQRSRKKQKINKKYKSQVSKVPSRLYRTPVKWGDHLNTVQAQLYGCSRQCSRPALAQCSMGFGPNALIKGLIQHNFKLNILFKRKFTVIHFDQTKLLSFHQKSP